MNKRCLDIPLSLLSQAPRTAREQIGSLSYEMLKQGDILLNSIFKLTNNQSFNWHFEAPHSDDPPEKQDGSMMFVRKSISWH